MGFFLSSCDDCRNISCEFGQCARGFCQCETGYVGDQCQVQNEPEAVIITSITIANLPEAIFVDQAWDEDTTSPTAYRPDVMLQVRLGTSQDILFNSIERFPDSDSTRFVFDEQLRIVISDGFPELRLTLADLDEPKPEVMYALNVPGYYRPTGGFPEKFSGEDEEGVLYQLRLEYEH